LRRSSNQHELGLGRSALEHSALAAARTDLSGCVSTETIAYGGASLLWYVPGTGEICGFLDCGGGRAPPKTTVPGCLLYSGTSTYSPSYLPGFKDGAASSTTYASSMNTEPSTAMLTGFQTTQAFSKSATPSSSPSVDLLSISTGTTPHTRGTETGTSQVSPSSSSTTRPSSTSSGSAPVSAIGNAGALNSVNILSHGLVGAAAVGVAFIL